MTEVYEVSRKYIMLFMHNLLCGCASARYLPLTGLLTFFVLPDKKHHEIFELFQIYFTPKNFMKFCITTTTTGNSVI